MGMDLSKPRKLKIVQDIVIEELDYYRGKMLCQRIGDYVIGISYDKIIDLIESGSKIIKIAPYHKTEFEIECEEEKEKEFKKFLKGCKKNEKKRK